MNQETLEKLVIYIKTLNIDYSKQEKMNDLLKEKNDTLIKNYQRAIDVINNFNQDKDEMLIKLKEIENFKIDLKNKMEFNTLDPNLVKEFEFLKNENINLKNQNNSSNIINNLKEENKLLKEKIMNSDNNNNEELTKEFENIIIDVEHYKKEVDFLTAENNELIKKIGINV